MNPPRNYFSLFLKVSILFLFFVLLILVPSGILVSNQQHKAAYTEIVESGTVLARQFARNSGMALLSGDILGLNLLIEGADKEPGTLYAVIMDKTKKVIAYTGPKSLGNILTHFGKSVRPDDQLGVRSLSLGEAGGYEILDIGVPITYKQMVIGFFHLGLSSDQIHKQLVGRDSLIFRTFVIYSLPGFFLCLIFIFLACKRFSNRMAEVVSAIEGLRRGEVGPRLHPVPGPFMGSLAAGLNALSAGFEERRESEQSPRVDASPRPFPHKAGGSGGLLPTQITRSQITVLFAGVKGFREYAENKAPEDVIVDLNQYFAIAARVAETFGGQVDKFIGDAVSCVFVSVPLQPDHTERAVKAALALQKALLDEGTDENRILDKIGIGISSGVALSGPVEALPNKVHTFIGESFKTAYSLNLLAGPGEIIISKDVFHTIEHQVTVEPVPPREMMDKTEPWENFRLKGISF
jgi:class 3 adenylate cyclase/uncharacterized membrane protein affecting hemolysin expression